MKLSRKKQKPQAPGGRQVTSGGRSAAFSYHANRSDQGYNLGRGTPRDQDIRRRERIVRYWRQRLGMFLAGVALIVCVLYSLQLASNPKIVSLTPKASGYFLQSSTTYQQAAAKAFASSLLNGNKITVNSVGIEQKLQRQFPELSQVSVTIPLMSHQPIVYIAPTTPSLILATSNSSFILDNNGKALISTADATDVSKLNLPTVTDQAGLSVKKGDIALAGTEVAFIQTVLGELSAKGVKVDSMALPTDAYQLNVKPAGVGYFVKFNMHEDTARQQVGTLLAVRERLASQGVTPGSYIDVRLDGRAYYK